MTACHKAIIKEGMCAWSQYLNKKIKHAQDRFSNRSFPSSDRSYEKVSANLVGMIASMAVNSIGEVLQS